MGSGSESEIDLDNHPLLQNVCRFPLLAIDDPLFIIQSIAVLFKLLPLKLAQYGTLVLFGGHAA
jgi:hypothetical protein